LTQAADLAGRVMDAAAECRPQLVDQLLRFTCVDAPSGDQMGLRSAADKFEEALAELGGQLERHTVSGVTHLSTRLGPEGDGHVLVLCHYDTVWPRGTAAERPGRMADGVISGPGVFDMRGGIVAALGALRLLRDDLTRPVELLLTGDEETGSETSRDLILKHARGASLVLVTEPPLPGGALKTSRKGWATYSLKVTGRAAHAGLDPDRGMSATDELIDQLANARAARNPEAGTTMNIGTIAGGTRTNVVAAEASAELEIRALTVAEQERADDLMRSLSARRDRAELSVTRRHSRPPMERTAEVAAAAARAKELARELGVELGEGAAGGSSDGNLVAPLGIPVLDGLGPEGDGAHAVHEHILVDSLVQRTALIALLLADVA
jgi:glutamate carboxypeptidase